jgi:hypothetical protein
MLVVADHDAMGLTRQLTFACRIGNFKKSDPEAHVRCAVTSGSTVIRFTTLDSTPLPAGWGNGAGVEIDWQPQPNTKDITGMQPSTR